MTEHALRLITAEN